MLKLQICINYSGDVKLYSPVGIANVVNNLSFPYLGHDPIICGECARLMNTCDTVRRFYLLVDKYTSVQLKIQSD